MWQAERALLMWRTGEFVKPSGTGTGSADERFCMEIGVRSQKNTWDLSWKWRAGNWEKVILQATNISMPERQHDAASVAMPGIAHAHALCVDKDSDEDAW